MVIKIEDSKEFTHNLPEKPPRNKNNNGHGSKTNAYILSHSHIQRSSLFKRVFKMVSTLESTIKYVSD